MEFLNVAILETSNPVVDGTVTTVVTSEGTFIFGHNCVDPETFQTSLRRADEFRAAIHAAYKPGVDVWLVTCAPDLLPNDLRRWHVCPSAGMRELRVGYQGDSFYFSVTPTKVQRRDLKKARKAKRKKLR